MTEANNTPSSSESCQSLPNENGRFITVFDGEYAQARLKYVNFEIGAKYEYIEKGKVKGDFTVLGITDEMGVDGDVAYNTHISEAYVSEIQRKPKNTTVVAQFHPEGNIGILDYISKIDAKKFRKVESIGEDEKIKDVAMGLLN